MNPLLPTIFAALVALPAGAQEKAVTPEGGKKLTAQQDKKLAGCRKQAGAKKLLGREREAYIVQCMKGQS